MTKLLTVLATSFASLALANTEIRNFRVDRITQHASSHEQAGLGPSQLLSPHGDLRTDVHELNATHNEHSFRIQPAALGTPLQLVCEPVADDESARNRTVLEEEKGCPHELWLQLDLDSAKFIRYNSFTLRLSWPAFYPTDFDITLFSSEELNKHIRTRLLSHRDRNRVEGRSSSPLDFSALFRIRYARIRLVDTGTRPPLKPTSHLPSLYQGHQGNETTEAVPFTIILEPLLFGVLPASVVPAILSSIPLLAAVGLAYPYVMRYLEQVAERAREELYDTDRLKQE